MTWVIFALLAPFTWAFVNLIDRFVMLRVVRTPFAPAFAYSIVGLVGSFLIYSYFGFEYSSASHITLAIIVGVLNLISSILYLYAAQREEISRIVPLLYFVPLFVSVFAAVFLNEVFSVWKYLGIALLIMGAILVTHRSGKLRVSRAFWFMLMSALFWAASSVLEKYLVQTNNVWTVYGWVRIGAGLGAPILGVIVWKELKLVVKTHGSSRLVLMGVNESVSITAQLFLFFALSLGPVSLVSSLGLVQSFFVLLLTLVVGIWYPKLLEEEMTTRVVLQKVVATVLMFFGAFLVV
ncbi:MAG: EamA family transporter [Patescibacteria group bacterium]|jgi:drug/metabolite transporter (DMT)-like permease